MPVSLIHELYNTHIGSRLQLYSVKRCLEMAIDYTPLLISETLWLSGSFVMWGAYWGAEN